MKNTETQNNDETIQTEANIQKLEDDANRLTVLNHNMHNQGRFLNQNIKDLESFNIRYGNAQFNNNQNMHNEQNRYDYFKNKAYSIIYDINKPNQPIRLWRYGNLYFYRPSTFSDLIIGTKDEIDQEISCRYSNVNIVFVDDINDVLAYKNMSLRIDTTYIAINSIPVVDEVVFDITRMDEVYLNHQGSFTRNILVHSPLLCYRLFDYDLKEEESYTKQFIHNITTVKDLKFLSSRLGNFFKHLKSSNAIVLVGNKDVSEGVLLNRILKPIFGSQFLYNYN